MGIYTGSWLQSIQLHLFLGFLFLFICFVLFSPLVISFLLMMILTSFPSPPLYYSYPSLSFLPNLTSVNFYLRNFSFYLLLEQFSASLWVHMGTSICDHMGAVEDAMCLSLLATLASETVSLGQLEACLFQLGYLASRPLDLYSSVPHTGAIDRHDDAWLSHGC